MTMVSSGKMWRSKNCKPGVMAAGAREQSVAQGHDGYVAQGASG